MKTAVAAVTLILSVSAQAQTLGAWPESKRPIADTASNIAVYSQIGLNTLHSWRSADRSGAFTCQAIRLAATAATAELLKRVIRKERPDGSDRKSFPSMHTGVGMASAGWKMQIGIPVAFGIGALRMGANRHDWMDVLAGAGIGYASGLIGPCETP